MQHFQFIQLVGFNTFEKEDIIKCLNDAVNNSGPIILDNTDISVKTELNIQIITLKKL